MGVGGFWMVVTSLADFSLYLSQLRLIFLKNKMAFPGGPVVKNPPANAEDTGLIPAMGRSHMLHSN